MRTRSSATCRNRERAWCWLPGLVFTIEPMVNAGEAPIDMSDPNGWTVRTADGSDTAQWEVQVAITEDGYELLSW